MFQGWIQIIVFAAVLFAIVPLLGGYMARVFTNERVFLTPVIGPLERLVYRLLRVDTERSQSWKSYAGSLLVFSGLFWLALYLILRTQTLHPFNPDGFHSGTWDVTFNTASSFITNTNWQYYGGETTMSFFSQMGGLAVQNFVSAAVGIVVAVALIRGIAARRTGATGLGNFWQDLMRTLLYVLLPISVVGALVLASQGVVQSLSDWGPVASQEIIKELGTNGGGFFNVNSAMPFENANGLTNFLEMLAMLAIPASLTYTYGRMVGSPRQGWTIFGAMFVLFAISVAVVYIAESHVSPAQHAAGLTGANMEGKEVRFGTSRLRALDRGHHGHVDRRRQLGLRVADRHRRAGPDGQPGLRRERLRRRRHRPVHDAALRPARGLHRRADGRPHARVPGQEDRGARDQARRAGPALHAAGDPRHHEPRDLALHTARRRSTPRGPQGFSESLYAYMSQANNNGSAFAGYTGYFQPEAGQHRRARHHVRRPARRHDDDARPLHPDHLHARRRRGDAAQSASLPPASERCAPTRPRSPGLLIGVVVLIGALTFFPALLLGPVVQGMTDRLF